MAWPSKRWTAALRFCDLLSLYLLCGLSSPVDLQAAPPIRMQMEGRTLRFSPQAMRAGTLSSQVLKHPAPAQGPRTETLTWEVEYV